MTTPTEKQATVDKGEHDHAAFGLALRVDPQISIPGLGRNPGLSAARPPSRIRLDAAELERRWRAITEAPVRMRAVHAGETLVRSVDYAESAGHLLWARNYGRILISEDGMELLCEPDPINDDWAGLVSSQALPLAATLRGLEVMHASGVVIDGRAVLIMGPPGAGKSSLAAALLRVGGQLLSDDAVALGLSEGALTAHAGSLALQLRASEDQRLSARERAALGRAVSSIEGKHRYLSATAPDATALGCVFLLERSEREPVVERLETVDPFELIAGTFNLSVRTPARLRRQLDVVSAIAASGVVHRLRIQPDVDATRLAAIVAEYLAGEL